jgi:hypothetical protein
MLLALRPIHRWMLVGMGALIIALQTGAMFSYDFEFRGIGWFLAYAAGMVMIVLGTQKQATGLPPKAVQANGSIGQKVEKHDMRSKLLLGAVAALGKVILDHADKNNLKLASVPTAPGLLSPFAGGTYFAYALLRLEFTKALPKAGSHAATDWARLTPQLANAIVDDLWRGMAHSHPDQAFALRMGDLTEQEQKKNREPVLEIFKLLDRYMEEARQRMAADEPHAYQALLEFMAPYFGDKAPVEELEKRFTAAIQQGLPIARNVVQGLYGKAA